MPSNWIETFRLNNKMLPVEPGYEKLNAMAKNKNKWSRTPNPVASDRSWTAAVTAACDTEGRQEATQPLNQLVQDLHPARKVDSKQATQNLRMMEGAVLRPIPSFPLSSFPSCLSFSVRAVWLTSAVT